MEREQTPACTRRINEYEPIENAVAEAIADMENITSLQVEPLYKHVDIGAVDTLLHSSESQVMISFSYKDYRIKVDGNLIEVFN